VRASCQFPTPNRGPGPVVSVAFDTPGVLAVCGSERVGERGGQRRRHVSDGVALLLPRLPVPPPLTALLPTPPWRTRGHRTSNGKGAVWVTWRSLAWFAQLGGFWGDQGEPTAAWQPGFGASRVWRRGWCLLAVVAGDVALPCLDAGGLWWPVVMAGCGRLWPLTWPFRVWRREGGGGDAGWRCNSGVEVVNLMADADEYIFV
jgi:hypothetical protein